MQNMDTFTHKAGGGICFKQGKIEKSVCSGYSLSGQVLIYISGDVERKLVYAGLAD